MTPPIAPPNANRTGLRARLVIQGNASLLSQGLAPVATGFLGGNMAVRPRVSNTFFKRPDLRLIATLLIACAFVTTAGSAAVDRKASLSPKGVAWIGAPAFTVDQMLVADGCDGVFIRQRERLFQRSCADGRFVERSTLPGEQFQSRAVIAHAPDGSLYYFGQNQAGVSVDDGASWQPLLSTGYPSSPTKAAISASGAIYLARYDGLHRLLPGENIWSPIFSTHVFELSVDAAQRIWAVTGSSIFVSNDGGLTWPAPDSVPTFPSSPTGLIFDAGGAAYVGSYWDGVYKSVDGGVSWQPARAGLPEARGVAAMAVAGSTLHALVGDQIHIAGVYQSTDGGASWTARGTILDHWTFSEVHSLGGQSDGTVWAATVGSGVLRLQAQDSEWIAQSPPTPHHVNLLRVALDGTLYAASVGSSSPHESYGLWRSLDGGASWTRSEDGLTDSYYSFKALSVDRAGRLFAATYDTGIFRSDDRGASWVRKAFNLDRFTPGALVTSHQGAVYAGLYFNGVWRSPDGGDNWSSHAEGLPLNGPEYSGVAVLSAAEGSVFGIARDQANAYGIYQSSDAVTGWTPLPSSPPGFIISLMARSASSLFAGAGYQGYVSNDGGLTWTAIAGLSARIAGFALAPDGRAVAAATNDGVYLSEDGDGNWQRLSMLGLPSLDVHAVAITNSGTILAGLAEGVYAYQDIVDVSASADVSVTIELIVGRSSSSAEIAAGGEAISFRIEVFNAGPSAVDGLAVSIPIPAGLSEASWTCVAPTTSCLPADGVASVLTFIDLGVAQTAVINLDAQLEVEATFVDLVAVADLPPGIVPLSPATQTSETIILGASAVFRSTFE